ARPDLPELVAHGADLRCHVKLVTSGLGRSAGRMDDLAERGLAHVQLSVQAASEQTANRIAGPRAHQHKLRAAELVRQSGLPLSVNVVLHRANHDELPEIIALDRKSGG